MSGKTKEAVVQQLMNTLNMLPVEKVLEVFDFASYLLKKHDDRDIQNGIYYLVENSITYKFLDEDDIYTFDDIK